MISSGIPAKMGVVWASGAGGSFVRTPPVPSQIGTTNGAASFTDGFPPLNFSPVASGGIPPFGEDMNGILRIITTWLQWIQAGGPIPYDSTFQTAIGGYPSGAVVESVSFPGAYWQSTVDNNTGSPDSGAAGWQPITLADAGLSGRVGGLVVSGTTSAGANIKLAGNGSTTPNKWIGALNGQLVVLNNLFSANILTLDDSGNLTAGNKVRATTGAFGSGDSEACTTLGDFTSSKTLPGYRRFPDGFIENWGATTVPGGSFSTVPYSLAFPNSPLVISHGIGSLSNVVVNPPTFTIRGGGGSTNAQFIIYNSNSGNIEVDWRVIGF